MSLFACGSFLRTVILSCDHTTLLLFLSLSTSLYHLKSRTSISPSPLFYADTAAKARIMEGPELWVKSDSTIKLSCVIWESSAAPSFVFWYHEGTVINYDSKRIGGVKVTNDLYGVKNGFISRLEMKRARSSDAGVYSCKPSYSDAANVTLHVISLNGQIHFSHIHFFQDVISDKMYDFVVYHTAF
jgi:hypothetical protein